MNRCGCAQWRRTCQLRERFGLNSQPCAFLLTQGLVRILQTLPTWFVLWLAWWRMQETGGELEGQIELSLNYCFFLVCFFLPPYKDRNGFSLCLSLLVLQTVMLVAAAASSAPFRERITSLSIIRSCGFSWPESQTTATLQVPRNSFPTLKCPHQPTNSTRISASNYPYCHHTTNLLYTIFRHLLWVRRPKRCLFLGIFLHGLAQCLYLWEISCS